MIDYLALGLNPQKATIFIQSQVSAHTELAWILGTMTPISWLERIPTYKEKLDLHPDYKNFGLLGYPVLMAADILLYDAQLVPVGEDQLPHLEIARMIAKKFNSQFGRTFTEPKEILTTGQRVMSLQKPENKMSKTGGEGIALSDSPEKIARKIKSAATDAGTEKEWSAGTKNLFLLLENFADKGIFAKFRQERQAGTIKYSQMKETLAQAIADHFADFRVKRAELEKDPKKIDQILADGHQKAAKIADAKLLEVKKKIGLM